MIGSCNQLSDYNFADKLEQNTPIYAPITFEEIVIVMITPRIVLHSVQLLLLMVPMPEATFISSFFDLAFSIKFAIDGHSE